MSRSYKHYPYIGAANSGKFDKHYVNKKFRRLSKIIICSIYPEEISSCNFPLINEMKDPYYFSKDGGYDIDITDPDFNYIHKYNGKIRK